MEYSYWEIWYVSCEGNDRHTVARAPAHWERWKVEHRIPRGGCGDDVAEITSVEETYDDDYGWDFT
jgi:hypothetical protein